MNALLKEAIAAIESLPEAEQQEVAEGLIGYVALVRAGRPLLTPGHAAGVLDARREAGEGHFAPDEEMADTWRKFGLRRSSVGRGSRAPTWMAP